MMHTYNSTYYFKQFLIQWYSTQLYHFKQLLYRERKKYWSIYLYDIVFCSIYVS